METSLFPTFSSFLSLVVAIHFIPLAASTPSYLSFLQCLSKHSDPSGHILSRVYTPNNSSYESVLQHYIRNKRFNRSTTPKPDIIFTPLQESHVQVAVICCRKTGNYLKIRSGGHDYEGISYVSNISFVLLDMSNLHSIDVDIQNETAWVQAGAILGELYYKIWEKSKIHAFPAGVCPTVGIGGHITGGGYGNLLRKYGLSVDNLIDAHIVDVHGRILNRESMGEDLFWAIRGGGGASFGVITAYKIRLVKVPDVVTVFRVVRTLEKNAVDIVYRWQFIANKIDNNLFIRLTLKPIGDKQKGTKTIEATFVALFLGDSRKLLSVMDRDFPQLGLHIEDCREMSWIESELFWASFPNGTPPEALLNRMPGAKFLKRKSDYLQKTIPKDKLKYIFNRMIELGDTELVFNAYGGRMNEIPEWETPFPHRAGNIFKIQYAANWGKEGKEAENFYLNQTKVLYNYMTPFVSKSPRCAFLNYRDLDIGVNHNGNNRYIEGRVYGLKYFKDNFDKLVKVKTLVDPDNFFWNEQSIPPLAA
ncbi:berberine bridge enzyme-like 21 [Lycium barbarum]|uniref:berberine bridge enzyme-like 21 n=1 Tax=Lycium barbarum TaxID=112863 RepID=UPI00293F0BB9|nr:berberine bridge enzyme-like 21 [Lycium barbarum]